MLLFALIPRPAAAAPSQVHLSWQGPTTSTMTVTWRSTRSSGKVEYGPGSTLGKSVNASSRAYSGSYLHQAQLTGLSAGASVHYRCGVQGDWSPTRVFVTAPANAAAAYRYAVHGDSRTDDSSRAKVRALMQSRSPAFSLHTGDFVSDGRVQSQWDTFFTTMEPLYAVSPMMGALGNHEQDAGIYYDQVAFPAYTPQVSGVKNEIFYAFDYGSTHFIALTSEHGPTASDPLAVWLKQDLIKAAKDPKIRFTVVFAHQPPYSSGPHGNFTAGQKAWGHLFESFGVDVTFWGHDHTYERTKLMFQGKPVSKGGVTYIVTGGAGAPLYTAKGAAFTAAVKAFYHFVEVNVSGSQMKLDTLGLDGKVFDTLTINKPGAKPGWIMDGVLDPGAKKLASGGAELSGLHAGFDGRYLYVATQGSGGGTKGDHFVLLSDSKPTTLTAAPWNKAGKTWQRAALLAMESTTSWSNWQDPDAGTPPIPYGSTWKYHDQGKDLGTAWLGAAYDDSAWKSGPGQLGYGDNDENTKLTNPDPNYPSVYFRRTFQLGQVPPLARLQVLHDDGVAVWINGKQVMSKYMSNGTGYSAWASSTSSDNELTSADVKQVGGAPFKVGQNVICAMVKQVNANSSDTSFDLKLELAEVEQTGFSRASNPAGPVMEGVIDLKARFGAVPQQVYLAAAAYGTSDNGTLLDQLPRGNGDGAIGLGEWVVFPLKLTPPGDAGPSDSKLPPGKDSKLPPGKDSKAPARDLGKTVDPPAESDSGCGVAGTGASGGLLSMLCLLALLFRRRDR